MGRAPEEAIYSLINFAGDLAAGFEAAQHDECSSGSDDEGEHTPSVDEVFNVTGWGVSKGGVVHFLILNCELRGKVGVWMSG